MAWVRPLLLLLCWLMASAHYDGVVEGFGGDKGRGGRRGGGWHGIEEIEGLIKGATRRAGLTLSWGWWLLLLPALVLVLIAAPVFKRELRYHKLRSIKLTPAEWGAAIGFDAAKPSRQLWRELSDGRRTSSPVHRSAARKLAQVAFLSECRELGVTALSTALRVKEGYDWLDGSPDLFLQNPFNGDIEGIVLVAESGSTLPRKNDAKDCLTLQAQCFMYFYGAHYCHLVALRRTPSVSNDKPLRSFIFFFFQHTFSWYSIWVL
ncbi:hypothetical protein QOT17_011344 [Balamuthia mandrillaris]